MRAPRKIPQPRERHAAVDTERIRALAPVLSATALDRWFNSLPISASLPANHRPVDRLDGLPLGVASLSWHASTMLRYSTTASLRFTPISENPASVTVRGRQLANRRQRTPDEIRAGIRFDPQMVDIDHLGAEGYPLVWRHADAVTTDLVTLGARFKAVKDPAIVRVQQETPITVTEAEQALLAFGGILLRAAGTGEQGLLFGDEVLPRAATS